MLFNSWHFVAFFPVVCGLYFICPYHKRWLLLLIASYYFYMCAIPGYALVLLASTGVDYFLGIKIADSEQQAAKRRWLWASVAMNLGVLFGFKYFNFFSESCQPLTSWLGVSLDLPRSDWLLPVGLSFYTFQTLSYSIDIYRGIQTPERHFGRYALFVSFFPQLVAGPIERSTQLLPQFRQNFDFDYNRVTSGLKLMAWGLFKKVVIADHLAVFVNCVYSDPEAYTGAHYALATALFAIQIYCDFSGYSDIAIGAARVLGFRLMTNFDRPYASRSVAEFWSRWHISLSTWFRDYLYIPLGGNRVAVPRWYLNLMIVFVISGLWHGASWTFVIWGLLHGTYLVVGYASQSGRKKLAHLIGLDQFPRLQAVLQNASVFILVCFAWIFFRANSLADAVTIVSGLTTGWTTVLHAGWLRELREMTGLSAGYFNTALILIVVLELVQARPQREIGDWFHMFWTRSTALRWAGYVGLLLAIINLGASKAQPFIYFQF